jgi:prepilin-type N-terminal cleavage/methylation domain-containing protein
MSYRNPDRTAGFSLVELTVTIAVIAVLVGVVVNLVVATTESQKYAERLSRATVVNQDLLDGMRQELASSVALFQNDTTGAAYRAMLDLDPGTPPLATSVLPTIDPVGIFAEESASAAKTGNSLLMARNAWTTEVTALSGSSYRVDVYRFIYYYLAAEQEGPRPGSPIGLNLCKFVSEPLADGDQIDRITDPVDLADVLQHLADATPDASGATHSPVQLVWIRKGDPAVVGTLRQIDPSYALSDVPLSPRSSPWTLVRDTERSSEGLLYYRHFSVASNHARRAWGVGRFGVIDNGGDGFPHGFEVQIVGPSSGRLILLHLTLATTNGRGHKAHSDMLTQVFVADV